MKIYEEKLPYNKTICDYCLNFKETGSWSFEYACIKENQKCESKSECSGFEPTSYAKVAGVIKDES